MECDVKKCYKKKCSAYNKLYENNCGRAYLEDESFAKICNEKITKKRYRLLILKEILKYLTPVAFGVLMTKFVILKSESPMIVFISLTISFQMYIMQRVNK